MALTGVFSIFLSSFIRKVGTRRALPLGVIIYAVGIRFRWYDQSLLAGVLSGLLGGVGASFVLLSIRVRARLYQADKISPKFIAARKTVGDVASGLAGFLIAGMISYFGFRAAVFCALLPLEIALLLGLKKDGFHIPADSRKGDLPMREVWANRRARNLLFLSLIGGVYSSLSVPYLPMLYRDLGMSAGRIPLLASPAKITALFTQLLAVFLSKKKEYFFRS